MIVTLTIEHEGKKYGNAVEITGCEVDAVLNGLYGATSIKAHELLGHIIAYITEGGIYPVCRTCRADREVVLEEIKDTGEVPE